MKLNQSSDKFRNACRKKFLYFFPKGFSDPKYKAWERGYKWDAHLEWEKTLNKVEFEKYLQEGKYLEIALKAVRIESRTNLLFSFEKMALRDAVKTEVGAEDFAWGLYDYVYGKASIKERFENFTLVLAGLPRKQTRVLTWPLLTVFGFIANPKEHIFLKPRVTQVAARNFNFDFNYQSKPNWDTYQSLLGFARNIKSFVSDLKPKDLMDTQSFIWVLGSEEYA